MTRPRVILGLRIAWTAWWAIVCVLLIVLWMRSFLTIDSLSVRIPSNGAVGITSVQGRYTIGKLSESMVVASIGTYGSAPMQSWQTQSQPIDKRLAKRIPEMFDLPSFPGFRIRQYTSTPPGIFTLVLPHWFTVLLCVTVAVMPWFAPRKRFSLRTLLIAITLIAAVLGLCAWSLRS